MDNHTVYWYHLKTHTDPFTEGYVGVTNDIQRRHKEHMRNSNGLVNHFYNAIMYYGKDEIILTILFTNISERNAYDLESIYRPDCNIGWNFAAGGKEDLVSVKSTPVTLFHQSNPEKDYTFKSITLAAKMLGLTQRRIQQAVIRKSNIYGIDGWSVVHENTDKTTILTIKEAKSINMKGKKKQYPNIWKGKTDRWSEEERKRIGLQHKGKKLSKTHVEILKIKNRLSSACKEIQLNHQSEPNKIFTFHSISEASRELNIPLSRLKSKCTRTLGHYGRDGWRILSLGSQGMSNEHTKTIA